MTLSTLFRVGVLFLLSAFLLACASDDDPQQQQPQQEQQTAAQEAQEDHRQQAAVEVRSDDDAEQGQQPQADEPSAAQQGRSDDDDEPAAAAQTSSSNQQQGDSPVADSQPSEQAESQQQTAESTGGQSASDDQPVQESQQSQEEEPEQDQPQQQSRQDTQQAQQDRQQTEQTQDSQPSAPPERDALTLRAEEIRAQATAPELTGLNGWLNGEETSIALELAKGNVVLIDFWTYTCINCVRTLPFLTAWDEKYRDHGLVIIGVHTPEFEFEERIENVRTAIAEHGIEYLVAIDNDYRTWRAFQNRWWPRKFLIGPTDDGSPMGVRYDHIGEGHYEETERAIRAALEAVGRDIADIPFGVEASIPTRESGNPRQTRELYAGWSRNTGSGGPYAGQETYFLAGPDIPTVYRDVETEDRQHNLWYLEGLWTTETQAIVHARETKNLEDYMALLVRGRTANVVLTVAEDGDPYDVYVQWDGDWLERSIAGEHIKWDAEGRSFIRVTENDLYRLIFLPEFGEGELILRSNSDQFRIFAYTFGAYVGGE